MAEVREFLTRVLPWPGDGPGWINLHWTVPNQKDPSKTWMRGKPFRTPDEMLSYGGWLQRSTDARDMYMCLSRQAKHTTSKAGKPVAMRSQQDALCLQSLFADLDGKNYDSKEDALKAFLAFSTSTGLLYPTDLVDSGGGWHIYWAFIRSLEPAEWKLYANGLKALAQREGLKIDTQVTINSAQILRVPGTYNFKQEQPRPVIWRCLNAPYDPAQFDWLKELAPPRQQSLVKALHHDPSKFTKRALTGPKMGSLSDGVEPPALAVEPILAGCQFLRDAVETGGKDYAQPAWNLTTLAATFLADGNALCHRMSDQHAGYSQEKTEDLWVRKLKEREEKGLGWPSCNAIRDAGSTACGACPHFAAGKSPLHLALPTKITVAEPVALETQQTAVAFLPPAYGVDSTGLIIRYGQKKGEPEFVQLFHCRLSSPWAQKVPYNAINFTSTMDKGCTARISLRMDQFAEAGKALASAGVKYVPDNKKHLENFFMAWLNELHKAAEASKTEAFGWYMPDGHTPEGFIYGGLVHLPGGLDKPSGYLDPKTMELYSPCGDIDHWYKCNKYITDQKRPDLELIVIAGFASVLMKFAGKESACLAAWGESGCGKSTAHSVGIAIYSHPVKTKEVALSTEKWLVERAGKTNALPLYKDEIGKGKRDFELMLKHLFAATDGITGGRLKADLTAQERYMWQSVIIMSGNRSFGDYLLQEQPDHDAGVKRIFEYEMHKPALGSVGLTSSVEVARDIDKLNANYGMMGLKYSRYLADHLDEVDQRVLTAITRFEDKFGRDPSERYWATFCGIAVVAGEIANELGCEFHLPEVLVHLDRTYQWQRDRIRDERAPISSEDWVEELLADFFAEFPAAQAWTNQGQRGTFKGTPRPGRPQSIGVVSGPDERYNSVRIHWDQEARIVQFHRSFFNDWVRGRRHSTNQVKKALHKFYDLEETKITIARGTGYLTGQVPSFKLKVTPKSPVLWEMLYKHTNVNSGKPDDQALADSAPVEAAGSDNSPLPTASS